MSKLTVAEHLAIIQKEREALDRKEKALLSQNREAALAEIVKIAHDNALSVAEISAALKMSKPVAKSKTKKSPSPKVSKPRGKVAPKYKNPANPAQTWTGRGKMPNWVKELHDNDMLSSALI